MPWTRGQKGASSISAFLSIEFSYCLTVENDCEHCNMLMEESGLQSKSCSQTRTLRLRNIMVRRSTASVLVKFSQLPLCDEDAQFRSVAFSNDMPCMYSCASVTAVFRCLPHWPWRMHCSTAWTIGRPCRLGEGEPRMLEDLCSSCHSH
jgi:hypothetical protein